MLSFTVLQLPDLSHQRVREGPGTWMPRDSRDGVARPQGTLQESPTCTGLLQLQWLMEMSRATTGQGLLYHLILQPVRDCAGQRRRALLLPLTGRTSSVKSEEPRGWGERQEERREAEQVQRDKEKEMEANISLSRNYLSWTLSSPP